ncbi:hypothetical protein TVAG_317760 [Trichomonas vaginalis G3]|uniref:Uncharacterized protein n=1 Tax=Trichomonas vaginalis (strain ATCC PRA-98 / G3) TaxID=412133 RepID=A2F3M3_TRIV3|nr:hypothetical protein TVAGG3_0551650 [Trichomonas vaginalis G3]EAY00491.1 hypothetical protein TVAG_317760 [Trichomonas vaginalis G3]KAI5520551.1 hypothetical protein TVAGG3_0551650 [Trichomonas vaginalis G3]|eukprot:XP_001313420.1 hypothetical protein [Trichomonas vaginalis G3]
MLSLLFSVSLSAKWDRTVFQDGTCPSTSTFEINDVYFENLDAESQNGGAITIRGCTGTLKMNVVTFIHCISRSTGGAIFIESNPYNVDATKVCVSKCSSTQNCQYAQFTSSQGTFTHTYFNIFLFE